MVIQKLRRAKLVSEGLCGWCSAKRNLYAWLCDACAETHRNKQRKKPKRCLAVSSEGERCNLPKDHDGMHEAVDGIRPDWTVKFTGR